MRGIVFKLLLAVMLFAVGLIFALWFKGNKLVNPVKWEPAPNPGLTGLYAPNSA